MNTNAVLDVVVGLVLMYLLLSLICTTVNEFITSISKLRARNLKRGVEKLIDDPNLRDALKQTGIMKAGHRVSGFVGPSYLPSRNFALALLEALNPEKQFIAKDTVDDVKGLVAKLPDDFNVKPALLALADDVANLDEYRKRVAEWFDEAMERAGGVYKRWMLAITFAIGLILTVIANADTIHVAKALWTDGALRGQIAEAASSIARDTGDVDDLMELKEVQASLRPFPVGWGDYAADIEGGWLSKIIGWLLTAIAISLGAPFWFDLLGKFVKIRASGQAPRKELEKQQSA